MIRQKLGVPAEGGDRQKLAAALTEAREQLGDREFEAARAEGENTPPDQLLSPISGTVAGDVTPVRTSSGR